MSFDDIIGRGSDFLPDDWEPQTPPPKEIVAPVASFEELRKPSPEPFIGRPDIDYPELDSLEPLYIPKFLLRRWGEAKCERSAYWALWKSEAERARQPFRSDPKPGYKK